MTEPNPPFSEPNPPSSTPGPGDQSNPWARPPEGAPEQPAAYAPPPSYAPPPAYPAGQPQPTANWAYDPHQPPAGEPGKQRSLTPIIAIIVAAVILLCVGTAVAGALVFDQARDAVTTPTPTGDPGGQPDPTSAPRTSPPRTGTPPSGTPRTGNPFQLPTGLPNLPDLPDDLLPSGVAITASPDAKVVYEVTGEGSAAVSYTDVGSAQKTEAGVALPWRKEFTLGTETPLLSVSSLRLGGGEVALTCRILLDGKEVVKRSATGNAATASCVQVVVVS